jgi:hypothetical protein
LVKKISTRRTTVRDTWIDAYTIADGAHPFHQGLTDIQDDVWVAYFELVTGTLPSSYKKFLFTSEEKANDYLSMFSLGTSWIDHLPDCAQELSFSGFSSIIPEIIDGYEFQMDRSERWLADEILLDRGISEGSFDPSERVIKALGSDRIAELWKNFSRKYGTVAMFEYCRRYYGASAIEFIAANYKFQMEVVEDYFAAGYLQRDLEIFKQGGEGRVSTALATDIKAGEGGGKSSQSRRDKRALALLEELEKLRFNTQMGKVMERGVLISKAKEAAIAVQPDLWKQGQGGIPCFVRKTIGGCQDMAKKSMPTMPRSLSSCLKSNWN